MNLQDLERMEDDVRALLALVEKQKRALRDVELAATAILTRLVVHECEDYLASERKRA